MPITINPVKECEMSNQSSEKVEVEALQCLQGIVSNMVQEGVDETPVPQLINEVAPK